MRGIYTPVVKIRRQIFQKVAQIAYSGEFDRVDQLPYEIIKGEVASYRESVFKERAIVAERIRLGLRLKSAFCRRACADFQGFWQSDFLQNVFLSSRLLM